VARYQEKRMTPDEARRIIEHVNAELRAHYDIRPAPSEHWVAQALRRIWRWL